MRLFARVRPVLFAMLAGGLLAPLGCDPQPDAPPIEIKGGVVSAQAYSAVRRYFEWSGGQLLGDYTERFTRAADGRFVLELLAMNGKPYPDLATVEAKHDFEVLQEWFQTGFGRFVAFWRDFQVQDPELFDLNYQVIQLAQDQTVAGRSVIVSSVTPNFSDRPSYEVSTDKQTNIVLKVREFLPDGSLASEMITDQIDLSPNLSGLAFSDNTGYVTLAETDDPTGGGLGAPVYEPLYLPAGFLAGPIKVGLVAGIKVLLRTWTDGVVELMLVQYPALTNDFDKPEDYPADLPVAVRVARYGPTLDAWFFRTGTQVHLAGKVESVEFKNVLESLSLLAY